MSSWLIRTALRHQTQPTTFMNMHFPEIKPDFWTRDVDIFWATKENFMQKLSFKSNVSIDTLRKLSLQSYTGYLAEKIHENTSNNFITSIKNRGRNNKNKGLRFCSQCLAEDDEPFFRKHWRISFVTVCPKHNCFLENICPSCHIPITPYKVKEVNMYCRCHYCGASLYNGIPGPVSHHSDYFTTQKKLLHILNTGFFSYKSENYYSIFYFSVLKQISKIVNQLTMQNKSQFIENMDITDQTTIYSLSESLLQDNKKMERFCQKNHLGKSLLQKDMRYIPYWYTKIVFK